MQRRFLTSIRLFLIRLLLFITSLSVATSKVAAENGSLIRSAGVSISPQAESVGRPEPLASDGASQNKPASSLDIRLTESTADVRGTRREGALGGFIGSVGPTLGALAITLGLFAVFVTFTRRYQKNQQLRGLPKEAFEIIGETEIGPKQKLLVVRCGVQALIVGVSPAGIQRVAQLDDPDEAGQFIAQCRGLGSETIFNSTLREMEEETTGPGFVDQQATSRKPVKRDSSKLFLRA